MLSTTVWTAFPSHLGNEISMPCRFFLSRSAGVGCTLTAAQGHGANAGGLDALGRDSWECILKALHQAFPLSVSRAKCSITALEPRWENENFIFGNSSAACWGGVGEVRDIGCDIQSSAWLWLTWSQFSTLPVEPSRGLSAPGVRIWGISLPKLAWLVLLCLENLQDPRWVSHQELQVLPCLP